MIYIWDYLYTNEYRPGSHGKDPGLLSVNTRIYWTQRDQRIISSDIEQKIARANAGEIARARIMNSHGKDAIRHLSTTASTIY